MAGQSIRPIKWQKSVKRIFTAKTLYKNIPKKKKKAVKGAEATPEALSSFGFREHAR